MVPLGDFVEVFKLLLLENLLNTDEAKAMAKERQLMMTSFLDEYKKETEGA